MNVTKNPNTFPEPMDLDPEPELSTKETLVYLEFGDKMKDYIFDQKIFFRMAELEGTPLIQLNNHIFKGKYQSCIGTNLFFTDHKQADQEGEIEDGETIRLQHQATQFKHIELTPVKFPSDMGELPKPSHNIQINKNYDYKSLLRKFAHGDLNLKEDLVVVSRDNNVESRPVVEGKEKKGQTSKKDSRVPTEVAESPHSSSRVTIAPIPKPSGRTENQSSTANKSVFHPKQPLNNVIDILTHKMEKLKRLALRPTRRKKEPEVVAECEEKYKEAYAYNSLKSMVMKPSDSFRTITEKFNEKTLEGAADIDRSVMQGVLSYSPKYYRVLSEDEKSAVLSIKNFDNLSLAARYIVIKSHLDHLESKIPTLCREEFFEKDSNGRTIRENIKIYKRLLRVLSGLVKEKYCYDSDED